MKSLVSLAPFAALALAAASLAVYAAHRRLKTCLQGRK